MLKFELANHPSQARHPVSGKPLFDNDKKPVPLFPNERSLYLEDEVDGETVRQLIAYVSPAGRISFIKPESVLTKHVIGEGKKFVEAELEKDHESKVISEPPEDAEEEDGDEEFEDEDEV